MSLYVFDCVCTHACVQSSDSMDICHYSCDNSIFAVVAVPWTGLLYIGQLFSFQEVSIADLTSWYVCVSSQPTEDEPYGAHQNILRLILDATPNDTISKTKNSRGHDARMTMQEWLITLHYRSKLNCF